MKVFEEHFSVNEKPEEYIRHVNNLRYLEWFIDAAIKHATLLGWGMQACKEHSFAWVAKTHCIEYLHPALQGDELIICTWIHEVKKSRVIRRYKCLRSIDHKILATAQTTWVLVDYNNGRPKALPTDLLQKFTAIVHKDTI